MADRGTRPAVFARASRTILQAAEVLRGFEDWEVLRPANASNGLGRKYET